MFLIAIISFGVLMFCITVLPGMFKTYSSVLIYEITGASYDDANHFEGFDEDYNYGVYDSTDSQFNIEEHRGNE